MSSLVFGFITLHTICKIKGMYTNYELAYDKLNIW